MRKKMIAKLALVFALVAGAASSAQAVFMPPQGPLFIQFTNREQISASNSIVVPGGGGATEGNWGLVRITDISSGDTSQSPQDFGQGNPLWQRGDSKEIIGIFAGASVISTAGGVIDSTGGSIYLFEAATTGFINFPTTTAGRTGQFDFTGWTDGILLAKFNFKANAIGGPAGTTIHGTAVPNAQGFSGDAYSFADVDTTEVGAWTSLLNSDYFTTPAGKADVKFTNRYTGTPSHSWNEPGTDILGAESTDPAKASAVPEPSTIALLGFGLIGIGFAARRKKA